MLNILSLMLLWNAAEAAPENSRLIQVQIIIRNADTAPMYEFTSVESAKKFPEGLDEISDEGLVHAAQQGSVFQERYTDLGLLTEKTNDSEIYIRSSPKKKTLMSAAAFSTAFTGHIMPRVHTTEGMDDEQVLIVHESIEHRCKFLGNYNISDQPFCRSSALFDELIKGYPDCAEFSYAQIEAALAEIENPAVNMDSALEKCARGDGRKIQFRMLSISPGIAAEFDIDRLREVIGPLMSIITKNIDVAVGSQVIEGVNIGAPIRIYYTQDHAILAAAHALGIISEYDERSLEFSSAIAIETWSSSEGFEIKIVLKDGVSAPFQEAAKYQFIEFKKQIRKFKTFDMFQIQWDEEITKIYTLMQFGIDVGQAPSIPINPKMRRITHENTWITEIILVVILAIAVSGYLMRRRHNYSRLFGFVQNSQEYVPSA